MSAENSYVISTESAAEMARLLDQDYLMTRALGGLLPEPVANTLPDHATVLDLGCGPGGWAQELLFAHSTVHVVGVDCSQTMIEYAQAQAQVQHLQERVLFQIADLTRLPWTFPDAAFDVVNARFMAGFLHRDIWPEVVQECFRILKPGGYVVLAEPEWTTSNSPAGERLAAMALRAFHLAGFGFSLDGRHLGLIHTLDPLLRDNGGSEVTMSAHILNMTFGRAFHRAGTKNLWLAYHLMADFFVKMGVASSKQEVIDLCQQFQREFDEETFCGTMVMARAWSQKPLA